MLLAIFNTIALPLELSFEPEKMSSKGWQTLNVIVDVSFFIDIVFIFRTAIFNSDMEVITDTKQIAVAYFKGMFWIDFLSTVPLDAMLILLIDKEKA